MLVLVAVYWMHLARLYMDNFIIFKKIPEYIIFFSIKFVTYINIKYIKV